MLITHRSFRVDSTEAMFLVPHTRSHDVPPSPVTTTQLLNAVEQGVLGSLRRTFEHNEVSRQYKRNMYESTSLFWIFFSLALVEGRTWPKPLELFPRCYYGRAAGLAHCTTRHEPYIVCSVATVDGAFFTARARTILDYSTSCPPCASRRLVQYEGARKTNLINIKW